MVLTWNIQNPSLKRATEQADWIVGKGADIVLLTEAKHSEGCKYIQDWLESYGYKTVMPPTEHDDYCVIVAVKGLPMQVREPRIRLFPQRAVTVGIQTILRTMTVMGVYVPSRGPIERRNIDKRRFQSELTAVIKGLERTEEAETLIIGGDLNVIERKHNPHYAVFGEWEYTFYDAFGECGLVDAYRLKYPTKNEYSWYGKVGDGYRFDHMFVSKNVASCVSDCSYIHDVRTAKLSDHSAMCLEIVAKQGTT
jgi:exonuclease III